MPSSTRVRPHSGDGARPLRESGAAAGQTWIAENAMMMPIVWPLLIVAVTLPLAVHRYQSLSR